jgi:hypothetical protein
MTFTAKETTLLFVSSVKLRDLRGEMRLWDFDAPHARALNKFS